MLPPPLPLPLFPSPDPSLASLWCSSPSLPCELTLTYIPQIAGISTVPVPSSLLSCPHLSPCWNATFYLNPKLRCFLLFHLFLDAVPSLNPAQMLLQSPLFRCWPPFSRPSPNAAPRLKRPCSDAASFLSPLFRCCLLSLAPVQMLTLLLSPLFKCWPPSLAPVQMLAPFSRPSPDTDPFFCPCSDVNPLLLPISRCWPLLSPLFKCCPLLLPISRC